MAKNQRQGWGGRIKRSFQHDDLLKHERVPLEFEPFLRHIQNLTYHDQVFDFYSIFANTIKQPDYDFSLTLLESTTIRKSVRRPTRTTGRKRQTMAPLPQRSVVGEYCQAYFKTFGFRKEPKTVRAGCIVKIFLTQRIKFWWVRDVDVGILIGKKINFVFQSRKGYSWCRDWHGEGGRR